MPHPLTLSPSSAVRLRSKLGPALLAVMCGLVMTPAWAQDINRSQKKADADEKITTLGQVSVEGTQQQSYTVESTTAGTRFDLSLREIPQSVSIITRDRMDDQNLQSITDVLNNVTGISGTRTDSERYSFYARGFYIDNFQFDGIPTTMDQAWSYSDATQDLAIYDRVEVVRGATGLLTGAGNPSASVNFVRKHATSRDFTGHVLVSAGRWDNRHAMVDVTTPLNASGSVRARVVGNYQDGDSYMDRYHTRKKLGYAVIDADLSPNTLLSVGYDYQTKNANDVTWGGFPLWYSDGSRTHYPISFNPATNWTFWNTKTERSFVTLKHSFDNRWTIKANATHEKSDADDALFYPYYNIYGFDRQTGSGVIPYSGRYLTHRKVDGLDLYADGPFRAFGREHQLVFGLSGNRRDYVNTGNYDFPGPMDSYLGWTGDYPQPDWGTLGVQSQGTITQKAAYGAARFSLTDPLTFIVGARYTDWKSEGEGADRSHKVTTPYAGLVYDLDDTWSTYVSYTDIFQPQTYKDRGGSFLDPVTGKSYEAGIKAAWFGGRLNGSLAVYRIEQDNVAQASGEYLSTGEEIYTAAKGTVSTGYDFELTGQLATGWNATFGASHYVAQDADDKTINTYLPNTTIKLFTSYTPQGNWNALTFGGGVNWQNRIYYVDSVYGKAQQSSYALVNLFARYAITSHFSTQLNLDNLLDKQYYSQVNSGYGAWGTPRSAMVTFYYVF